MALQGHRRRAGIWDHWNSQIAHSTINRTQCKGPILSLNQSQQPQFIVSVYIGQQFFRNSRAAAAIACAARQAWCFITGTVYTAAYRGISNTICVDRALNPERHISHTCQRKLLIYEKRQRRKTLWDDVNTFWSNLRLRAYESRQFAIAPVSPCSRKVLVYRTGLSTISCRVHAWNVANPAITTIWSCMSGWTWMCLW
jgi:hypothetical protein